MKLIEWEIWHSYSTYLSEQKINLEHAANILVDSRMALCSMHRDGRTFWQSGKGTQSGQTKIILDSKQMNANIMLETDSGQQGEFASFAQEAWYQSANLRFKEMRLFGNPSSLPPPYIRVYLGQCNLFSEHDKQKIICYPIIKLFESGILLVEFRTISPNSKISLEDFISKHINLYTETFKKIEVPPAVTKYATYAYYQYIEKNIPFHLRVGAIWLRKQHELAVDESTRESEEGDFVFKLAPLSKSDSEDVFENLSSLANTLFYTVSYLLSNPRIGINYIFRGQKSLVEVGDFWVGRPHIFIVKFENQKETAKENEAIHRSDFGRMLFRTMVDDREVAIENLPKDSRLFDDFNAYINREASLWVWSNCGIRKQKNYEDQNRGHLIYEHQTVAELLEYGYMLHRSLYDRSSRYSNTDDVLIARKNLISLKHEMREASCFGEVRDMLISGWNKMGVPELQKSIEESLSIKEAETSIVEARGIKKLGLMLSIFFGILAVSSVAKELIGPLWDVFGFWRPQGEAESKMFMIVISALFVSLVIFWLFKKLSPFRNKKEKKKKL